MTMVKIISNDNDLVKTKGSRNTMVTILNVHNTSGVALAGSIQGGDGESPRKRSVEGNTRRNANDGG